MKNFKNIILLTCAVALMFLTGCAAALSNVSYRQPVGVTHGFAFGDVTYPTLLNSHTEIKLDTDDFEIIKTVSVEATSMNVLGIVGLGDNGYIKLFEKARMAGADDIINIKVDTQTQSILTFVYRKATTKLTGTAIRWRKK